MLKEHGLQFSRSIGSQFRRKVGNWLLTGIHFVKPCPDLLAGLPDHSPEAAPRIAQCHHEQAGTTVPAALGIDRQRALAIVDQSLLSGEELNTIKLLGIVVSQRAHKSLAALIAGRKAKLIDKSW